MRQIAVIGLSTFGLALVQSLAKERCRVLAVDIDEGKVNAVRDLVDEAVIADTRDPQALRALRVTDYDAIVLSLGEPLDASLLAVLHLRDLGVTNIVAKAVSEDHRRLLLQLGVEETIFPEADTAQRTARTLSNPGLLDTLKLGEDILLVETAPPDELIGHTLADLGLRHKHRVTIIAIHDMLRSEIRVNPDPHVPITDSDSLIVLGKDEDIRRFTKR